MIAQQIKGIIQMHNERIENAKNEDEKNVCIEDREKAIARIEQYVNEALQEMKEIMAEEPVQIC